MPGLPPLENYYHQLVQWNDKLNLIAPNQIASFDYFNQHHLAPSLWLGQVIERDLAGMLPGQGHNNEHDKDHRPQAASAIGQNHRFIDLGSGNGLPAIPLALSFGQAFIMVEKINKKATALQAMVADLRLDGVVVARTMEEVLPSLVKQHRPGFMTARALLPLPKLLPLLSSVMPKKLPLYLLKGEKIHDEWQATDTMEKQKWRMKILAHNDAGGVVARLEKK